MASMLRIDSNQTIIVGTPKLTADTFVSFPPPGEQAYNIDFHSFYTHTTPAAYPHVV